MKLGVGTAMLFAACGAGASAQTPQPAAHEFQLNGYTTGNQGLSRVAVEPDGDFVVVWQSAGHDGAGRGHR